MKKCVITIGRQCGSGGHTIGKTVAERLGIPLYDKKLVQIVAERSGLSAETVRREGEYSSASSLFTSISSRGYSAYNANQRGNMALPDQINAYQTELIKELADEGMTMVIVTHEMGFAREVATRVLFMDGGYIVEEAPPEELFTAPKDARLQQFLKAVL